MIRLVDTCDIPDWAICALEYGVNEASGLTAEDIEAIEEFTARFPHGYMMDIKWDDANEFDRYPSIGKLPCRTIKVDFFTDSKD